MNHNELPPFSEMDIVGDRIMYLLFTEEDNIRLASLRHQINSLSTQKTKLKSELVSFNADWFFRYKIPTRNIDKITWDMMKPFSDNSDTLIRQLRAYLMSKDVIENKKEKYKEIRDNAINRKEYKVVVDAMWEVIKRKTIDEGYIFITPYNQGTIFVSWYERKEPKINKRATIDNYRRLKAEGKVPKTKDNPDGIPYELYYDDLVLYFNVNLPEFFPMKTQWQFDPILGRGSLVHRLYEGPGKEKHKELYIEAYTDSPEEQYEDLNERINQSKKNIIRL